MKKLMLLFFSAVLLFSPVSGDYIVLKDEQKFEADVTGFDSYYLMVKLANNKTISIPWNEVRLVKHTTTASSWLEETYMNNDDVEITSYISPLSESEAFQKAVFPGFIMHGSGHFYGKDQNMGFSLMSAEIVSLIIMGISLNEIITPVDDQSNMVSQVVFYTGLGMFSVSWLWDMIFAPSAAAKFNSEHVFAVNEPADSAATTLNAKEEIKK